MSNNEITIKYVEEAGFSPEVVSIFARTSVAASTLKDIIAQREAQRLLRKLSREGQKLAIV